MQKNSFTQLLIVGALSLGIPVIAHAQIISTVAGCGIGDDSIAIKAELTWPTALAFDKSGNTYVADKDGYRIRKIDASGAITTYAGNGIYGCSGDGGPATSASLGPVTGIAADTAGNIYIVDAAYNCIRKVTATGIISTIAGSSSTAGYGGDGGPAIMATLNDPVDILVDASGNLIFTDYLNAVVREISTAGIITTIVGDGSTGGATGSGGPATESELGYPYRIALDRQGNLYVAENSYICKVDTTGILTIISDTSGATGVGSDGDGGPAVADTMTSPTGIAVDTLGNVYFSDFRNNRIRKIDVGTGIVSNYAATGVAGYGGDGSIAVAAQISFPQGLAIDKAGNLYICDADNNRIRMVSLSGTISTFAGQSGLFGEGYPGANSELCGPANIAADNAGNVYIADYYNNRVRKLDVVTGNVTTVAGSGTAGISDVYSGDGGPAISAELYYPSGITFDAANNMYIVVPDEQRVRKVTAAGIISTVAGDGIGGAGGDGGLATSAELYYPAGVAADASGNIYIADQYNSKIRKVSAAGVITTFAGNGSPGFSGDGGAATSARLYYPSDVAIDLAGNVYIADAGNNCVRKVDTNGIISSITLHSATGGFSGDGHLAIDAELSYPSGLKVDNIGDIYIADGNNQRVRRIDTSGIINTIAGNGTPGFSGDGGLATAALINGPTGVAIDNSGNVYVADGSNDRIRKITRDNLTVQSVGSDDKISEYPNPAHSEVFIEVSSVLTGDEHITLYDAIGQEVLSVPLIKNKQAIDLSNFAAGVYIVQVSYKDGVRKMIKVTKE